MVVNVLLRVTVPAAEVGEPQREPADWKGGGYRLEGR